MRLVLLLAAASMAFAAEPGTSPEAAGEFFEAKIRPLFASRCSSCHGDKETSGLRLDSRAAILKGGKSGPAIVPGKPDESLLIQAVAHRHPRLRMPPNGQLEPREVADLEQWVKEGAVWPESPREFFLSKVKPVFDASCMACHGAAAQAGLRLDSRESLLKGGKSGPAVIPGDPARSLLMQAVRQDHDTLKMPPAGRIPDEAIANLGKWVKDGAVWPEGKPGDLPVYVLRPDQKAFWSFQPLRKPPVPEADRPEWNRNPVDRFIYAKLKEKGLTPGRKADKATLLRRATFDLTGLPATREEVAAFMADQSPNAFETRLDKMLASQQYGERWGRHWLDVARYADTAGDAADFPVPEMYKYRNYVIDSFRHDKPYNQFLREQIAGDLLPYKDDDQRWEQIVATGYITVSRRVGVSPTGDRHVTLEDTIGNFGQTMLGLSIGCARCHDHKFDPIPTADYYALYGIFDSTTYPFSGEEHNPYRGNFVYRVGAAKAAEILKPFDEVFAPWKKLERQKFAEYQEFQDKKILTPGRSREVVWKELTEVRENLKPFAEAYPPLETAWAASEGKPHDVKIQIYGEPKNTGALVRRGFPLILGGMKVPESETGSGRKELAEWLTDPANPLPARVMVNRIWHYHFGKGIVATTSDFGVRGAAPTHPELLDYLASRFLEDGWSVRKMHKLILLSETYQLASAEVPANSAVDPQNSYLWRQNRQRLDAEEISDSIRLLSGTLDLSMGGRQPFPNDRTYFYRQHEPFTGNFDNPRRAVYGMQQRIQKNPYLDLFDGPDGNLPMSERRSTTTSLQALYLMNSEFLAKQSGLIADKLMAAAAATPQRIEWAYETIFGRAPQPAELQQGGQFLATLGKEYGEADGRKAWASYIHAMLSSNPFLFVD
ncbi:MAG: PSD1 and planctomycete cytochrome C domain-containing protein [Acidobacteriota bacterium]